MSADGLPDGPTRSPPFVPATANSQPRRLPARQHLKRPWNTGSSRRPGLFPRRLCARHAKDRCRQWDQARTVPAVSFYLAMAWAKATAMSAALEHLPAGAIRSDLSPHGVPAAWLARTASMNERSPGAPTRLNRWPVSPPPCTSPRLGDRVVLRPNGGHTKAVCGRSCVHAPPRRGLPRRVGATSTSTTPSEPLIYSPVRHPDRTSFISTARPSRRQRTRLIRALPTSAVQGLIPHGEHGLWLITHSSCLEQIACLDPAQAQPGA